MQSAIGLVADDMISRCLSKKRKHTYVLWILRAGEREKVQGKLGLRGHGYEAKALRTTGLRTMKIVIFCLQPLL